MGANILFSKLVIPWPNYSQCTGDFHIFESWLFFFVDGFGFSHFGHQLFFKKFLQTFGGGKTKCPGLIRDIIHKWVKIVVTTKDKHMGTSHGHLANGVHSTPTMCMQGKLVIIFYHCHQIITRRTRNQKWMHKHPKSKKPLGLKTKDIVGFCCVGYL